jgi:hypothetical protein
MKNAAVVAVIIVLLVFFFSWLSRRSKKGASGTDPLAHKNLGANGGVPQAGIGGQDTGGYGGP